MTPERYQQVKAAFEAALELEPDCRAAFLEKSCGDDSALLTEVRSLLEHDAASGAFLEQPAVDRRERKPGTRVGQYEITEPIGAGAMGEVYRARDSRLGREVAIKFLPAGFARDPDRVARFERESRAAGALNHPNVLTVHDCGTDCGVPYLVTELLEGETLRQRMERPNIRPETALRWIAQIARGLGAAHEKAIVHRDLKPENLFLTRDGTVKILDFGLAKLPGRPDLQDGTRVENATEPGLVMGTAGYMSPEQVRGETADPRSDLFSVGAILYELLTGRRPFERATWVEEMNAILRDEPQDLPGSQAGVADTVRLQRLVRRCLAKPVEERFQSARDLAFALEWLLDPVQPQATKDWIRPTLVLALAAGLLVSAAFFTVRLRPPAPPNFQTLTFRRGIVSAARFTADGSNIVYSAAWDLNDFEPYMTRPDSPESHPLGLPHTMLLAVSSQGEMALCLEPTKTQHGLLGKLARVPLNGGKPQERADGVASADWSPDGSKLAAARLENGQWKIEYPLSNVVYQSRFPGGYLDALRVSPRGDEVAFLEHPLVDDSAGSVAMVDAAGKHRVLSSPFNSMRGLAWSPNGKELWFAAAKGGLSLAVWAVDRSGHERVITRLPAYLSLEDIAKDGRVLISQHTLSESMIYVPAHGPQRDLYWHDQSQVRDISRTGALLFSESGDATKQDYDAYLRDTDGSAAIHLSAGLPGLPLSISNDGRWVIANPAGSPAQLILLPTGTGEARKLTSDEINHVGAAWLRDGDEFVFAGTAPGSGLRYYRQSTQGGRAQAITEEGVYHDRRSPIVVSPDGKFVAALGKDQRVTLYPTGGGDARQVPGLEPGFTPLRWCDQRLVVHRYDERQPKLWKVDVASGRTTLWKEIAPPNLVGLLDITPIRVSPDCSSYAYSPLNVYSEVLLATGLK